jgi:hypothetical protein
MPTAAQQSRRRKGGRSTTGNRCSQQQMKLNGHSYVHRAMRLELQAAAHLQALQEVQAEWLAARTREQVLPDTGLLQAQPAGR